MTTASVIRGFEVLWLMALPVLLGLLPGTFVTRRLHLPAWCWLPLTMASGALVAWVLFWVYFFFPEPAKPVALATLVASVGVFVAQLGERDLRACLRERDAWLPAVLMFLLLTAYLAYLAWPGTSIWDRFTMPSPPEDNLVPKYLAEWLYAGFYRGTTPPTITQLPFATRSSDRPPLQAAVVLAIRPALWRYDMWQYEVVTAACQLGWVPGLYALGRALRLSRRQIVFGLAGVACTGFVLMQSLYTWPKLFAAWLFLTALALMIHAMRTRTADGRSAMTVPIAIAIGALLGLSLLAHGGPFFSIVALPVLFVLARAWRLVPVRHAVLAACTMAIVLAPWIGYQRYYDPPGNRLLRIHLAGVEPIDSRGTLQTIVDSYRQVTWADYLAGRWANVEEQWLVFGKSGRSHPVDWVQWQQFFHHIPAMDVLALGYLAFAASAWRRRRTPARHTPDETTTWLTRVTWYAIAATLVWIVILFPSGSAMMHHGSYGTTLLLFFCGAAWLATWPRPLGTTILALHIVLFIVFWCGMRTGLTTPPIWNPWIAIVMVLAFVAFALALRWVPANDAEPR